MAATCSVTGPWSNITGTGYVTRQEFYKTFLSLLCQISGQGMDCEPVTGVWSLISGTGNVTEQEFMANSLNLLCTIANAGGVGGGGSGTTNLALGGLAPPVDGTVPTFRVYDTDTGNFWYNPGTIAAPTWVTA